MLFGSAQSECLSATKPLKCPHNSISLLTSELEMSRGNEFVILKEFQRLIYVCMPRSGLCLEAIIGVVIVLERTLY